MKYFFKRSRLTRSIVLIGYKEEVICKGLRTFIKHAPDFSRGFFRDFLSCFGLRVVAFLIWVVWTWVGELYNDTNKNNLIMEEPKG